MEKELSTEDALEMDWKQITEANDEIIRRNNRLLRAIKNVNGEKFYNDLISLFEDSEVGGGMFVMPLKISRKTTGKYQKENWGKIKGLWVDQYVNGGMEGDSFEGYIYVKIKKDRFIKANYSM